MSGLTTIADAAKAVSDDYSFEVISLEVSASSIS